MQPIDTFGDGPGKTDTIVVWQNGAATRFQGRWGLKPFEPDGRSYNLLRAEGRKIINPCLIVATEFMISGPGGSKKRHRVTFNTSDPFFCFAGVWQPETDDWPLAFAGLTVEASPDIAPFKDRHLGVVRRPDYQAWLMGTGSVEDILRPHPLGSFTIEGSPERPAAIDDLFAA